jgi:hypothetical protein
MLHIKDIYLDFPTGGGAPGLSYNVLLHPAMSTHRARHVQ